jgi:elongation factor 1-alpha
VSNKTGYYIDVLKTFITGLDSKNNITTLGENTTFTIESKFNVKGVGIVLAGIAHGSPIKVGDDLFIGPNGKQFSPIKVWSIHDNYKNPIHELPDKMRGCIAIRIVDKKLKFTKYDIKKGMLVVRKPDFSKLALEFSCRIRCLHKNTVVSHKYSPVIHCGTIRQSAQIILDRETQLKLSDEQFVNFKFIKQPEYLEVNSRFLFRDGTTKGIGVITKIIPIE